MKYPKRPRPPASLREVAPGAPGLLPVTSVMHAHLGQVLINEAHRLGNPIRLLDCGCGDGRFLEFASTHLAQRLDVELSPWGFDVHDYKIQTADFFTRAADRLDNACPTIDWENRLTLLGQNESWPYEDASFDAIVSNQVGEHLFDIDGFFSEISRTLRPGGISVHIFPLKNYLLEGHTGAPFAHRVLSHDALIAYFRVFGRLGLARLGPLHRTSTLNLEDYAVSRADYVRFHTCYRTFSELACAAQQARLRISYRYTPELYALKVGYLIGRDAARLYSRSRNSLIERVLFSVLKRVSSVTIFLEKADDYDPERN
jgi:SAM-dependent methyltransferase